MSLLRRARARKASDINEIEWAFINDALEEDDPRCQRPETKWRCYELRVNQTLKDQRLIVDDLWKAFGANVVARWAIEQPGTRPSLWWKYDAPRVKPGTFKSYKGDTFAEPRRRLGGIGTPIFECLAYVPEFRFGVPSHWISQQEVDYYTGKAKDIHGRPIAQEYKGRAFRGVAIDPNNPPLYESEAAYLERHSLFLPGERARLTAEDFEPEVLA